MITHLYLLKRDKKGLRILSTFNTNNAIYATRINNIKSLNLPKNMELKILSIIEKDRMLWEPWIESSPTYRDLKISLMKRGYSKLPITAVPEVISEGNFSVNFYSEKPKTMLRKIN